MKKNEMFYKAQWVGVNDINTPLIQYNFSLEKIEETNIYICGLGFFYLYVNDQKVSNDIFAPVRSDYVKRNIEVDGKPFDEEMRHRVYVMKYDITEFLKKGDNRIVVFLGPGFFDNYAWSYDHPVKFGDVRLIFEIRDKNDNVVCSSDSTGKYHKSCVVESDIFKGETIDYLNNFSDEQDLIADINGWQDVVLLDDLDTEYYIQTCPNDTVIRTIVPKLIKTLGEVRVYDIGENTTGRVVLRCKGNKGDEINISYSEELNTGKAPSQHFNYKQYTKITLDGKERLVRPRFVWYGFRYFSIKGNCDVYSVEVIHANISPIVTFECDNKTINWLFEAYIRTQLSNMHSGVPSDCPHIEKRGYTGDGQLCARSAMLLLDSKEFYRKWIDDILDCQDFNTGHVQYTAPYQRCGGGPGGWGIAIITVPYEFYLRYDDKSVLEKAYPQMLKYLSYLDSHSEGNLVSSDRKGSWCLGEWCTPNDDIKISKQFVNTYFHIKALIIVEKIENLLGIPNHDKDNAHRKEIIDSFMSAFYDENTCSFQGGVNGADAFAIDIGLGNEKTLKNLVRKYKELGEYDTGIFGTEILTRVLLEYGFEDVAFSLITSDHDVSFEAMRKNGATTLWERFPGVYERSHNHPMLGAFSYFIVSYLLGLRNASGKAGYKEVIINPRMLNNVKRARGTIKTENGMIKIRYANLTNKNFYISIPKGIKALFKYGDKKQLLSEGETTIII